MASILVTGCEEDGTDQSANVASGTSPSLVLRVLSVLADISARVYTSRGGRSSEKSRLTCLARVRGHPHPSTPPPTHDATLRTSAHVIVRDVISTTTRDENAIYGWLRYGLQFTCYENRHASSTRAYVWTFNPVSRIFRMRDATGVQLISSLFIFPFTNNQ